jgi:hypothetical protein
MKPQVSTPEVANCSTCPDVPVPGNEKLEAVDSANLIRDLAVDAERVLSDRTDAHMNDLVSGCGYSENANHDFVAEVPVHARVAHNAWSSRADESGDESWNITTCRDIPSDMLIDLTLTIQEFV